MTPQENNKEWRQLRRSTSKKEFTIVSEMAGVLQTMDLHQRWIFLEFYQKLYRYCTLLTCRHLSFRFYSQSLVLFGLSPHGYNKQETLTISREMKVLRIQITQNGSDPNGIWLTRANCNFHDKSIIKNDMKWSHLRINLSYLFKKNLERDQNMDKISG